VVEWSRDAVNWAKTGASASLFPVVEIADPEVVPFPGFDHVLITHAELQAVIEDSRYAAWRTALGAVQGIYLIADTSTGQLYVGKADASSAAGPPTPATVTAATSPCANSPASTQPTPATSSSASCASSAPASLPPRSTRLRPTSNAPYSRASTG